VIYRTGKRFHFVVTEAVLRYLLCPPEVTAGQLDRLVSLSTLTTIRFGVIPFEVQYTVAPVHGFYVYDERMVRVETSLVTWAASTGAPLPRREAN
jgi:hypothetical protein